MVQFSLLQWLGLFFFPLTGAFTFVEIQIYIINKPSVNYSVT